MQGEESAEKIEILHELEQLDEPEVTRFLASIVGDANEYDLARIEALKNLEMRRLGRDESREFVARVIQRVLAKDEDDQVRIYAARSLANFTDVPGVLAVAGALVLDDDEDDDVRHNAFFALERSSPTEEAIDLITKCLTDPEFKDAAARVLAKWHGLGV
jgi:HEAT repeat protein